MLLKNVFYKELVANAARILTVLVIILPITELFKLLDQAASGHIPQSRYLPSCFMEH